MQARNNFANFVRKTLVKFFPGRAAAPNSMGQEKEKEQKEEFNKAAEKEEGGK